MANLAIRRASGQTFAGYAELRTLTCPTCGVLYAVPERLLQHARKTDESWYCPNGHSLWCGENPVDKLERQLRATRDLLAAEESAHQATVADAKRQKKRAAAGVCPCCNRTFQQLARHMASQHPGYGKNGNGGDGFKDLPVDGLLVAGWSSTVVHLARFGAKRGKRATSMCGLVEGYAYPRDDLPEHDKALPLCSKCAPYA